MARPGPRAPHAKRDADGNPVRRKRRSDFAADGEPTGYKWEQFKEGNTAAVTHGVGPVHRPGRLSAVREREAMDLLARVLGDRESVPEWLSWPQFRPQVEAWARWETKVKALAEYLEQMPLEEQMMPTTQGGHITPVELWMAVEKGAQSARDKLGLTPAAWAKIRRDLGLNFRDEVDSLASLAQQGSEIRRQREAKVIAMPRPDDGDGDDDGAS